MNLISNELIPYASAMIGDFYDTWIPGLNSDKKYLLFHRSFDKNFILKYFYYRYASEMFVNISH